MMQVRDALAHGKTETAKKESIVNDPDDRGARYPEPKWMRRCSEEDWVRRTVEDAGAMAR